MSREVHAGFCERREVRSLPPTRPGGVVPLSGSKPSRSRNASPRGWRPEGCDSDEDKTQIVHLSEGFDFLGFNVRHYRSRGKLLIKPSKAAVKRFRARLRAEVRSLS